jgi:hypothetical protein
MHPVVHVLVETSKTWTTTCRFFIALYTDQYLIEKESLDVEGAKTILSSYISAVIKKALRFIRENNKKDDKEALLSQIKACNEIIQSLSKLADESSLQAYQMQH